MKTRKISLGKIKTFFSIKLLILLIGLLVFGNVNSQTTNCNAKLEVVNNSKKAGESGVFYRLKLTNISLDASTYEVKLVNDTNRPSFSKNNQINSKGDFYNVSLKRMKKSQRVSAYKNNKENDSENEIEIYLKGKESKTFFVKIKTPVGAKIGSINKSKVQVSSNKCRNNMVSVILKTEIINGE